MAKVATVACKLPNGLRISLPSGDVVLLGAQHKDARFGYGFTAVNADEFQAWFDQKKAEKYEPVMKELIFVSTAPKEAEAQAKEKENVPSGFEGVDGAKPGPGVEKANEKDPD
jgi:hypothetical protein